MNSIELKANQLSAIPQVMWFEGRYKPMALYIQKLLHQGDIKKACRLSELCPIFTTMGMQGVAFEYEGELYVWYICCSNGGATIDNCHLEIISERCNILNPRIVLSSDDDPNQDVYTLLLIIFSRCKNAQEFKNWMKSKLITIL